MKYSPVQIKMQGFTEGSLSPLPIFPCSVCWYDDVLTGSVLGNLCDLEVTNRRLKAYT